MIDLCKEILTYFCRTDEGITPITDVREARDQGTGGAINAGLTALQFMPFNPSSTAKTVGGRVLSNLGQGALINTALEGSMIASEAGMGKELTPEEIATRLATSSLLGGVMEGAGGIGRAGGKVASNTTQTLRDTGRDIISKNGPMGREYTQFSGGNRPDDAIEYINRRQQGVAKEALPSSQDGNVDLPYGRQDYYVNNRTDQPGGGYGLAHAAGDDARNIDNVYGAVDDLQTDNVVAGSKPSRTNYINGKRTTVVNRDFNGEPVDPWYMTSFEETKSAPGAEFKLNSDTPSTTTQSIAKNTTDVNSKVEIVAEAPNGAQVVRETAPSGAQREYVVNTDADEAAQIQAQRQAVKRAEDNPTIDEVINELRSDKNFYRRRFFANPTR